MTVRDHFRAQAAACARLGSPFTAALLEVVAEGLDERNPVGRAILSWPGDPKADALALRLAGSLHALVLSGAAPALAAVYPGGAEAGDPAALEAAVSRALETHADFVLRFAERPPQTNEVGRSAVLLGGFLTIAAATGLPLRLLEIGASAGLNLHWDAYAYDLGDACWGLPDAVLRLSPVWHGPRPPLLPVEIRSRRACDRTPIDPNDDDDRLRLRAYVWADQANRRRRLEAALALAAASNLRVERADSADWVEARLAEPAPGTASVLYHSIVWQYLPAAARRRIEVAIARAGDHASAGAPFAWLRMEPAPDARHTELRLTLWPTGHERLLANADFHGRWVRWLPEPIDAGGAEAAALGSRPR
jgi:hypothetical protein